VQAGALVGSALTLLSVVILFLQCYIIIIKAGELITQHCESTWQSKPRHHPSLDFTSCLQCNIKSWVSKWSNLKLEKKFYNVVRVEIA